MKDEKKPTPKCAGCDKPLSHDVWSSKHGVAISVAPDHEVEVCGGGRSARGAKAGCVLKALQKLSVCPGCGKPVSDWPINNLCESCGKKLDLADSVQRSQDTRRFQRTFEASEIVTVDVGGFDREGREAATRVLKLVVEALGVDARELTDGFSVEVTEKQARAIRSVCEAVASFGRRRRLFGFTEGRSMLLGLAEGSLTPTQFADAEAKRTKAAQAGEEVEE